MKYIILIIFLISISLYSQYDFKHNNENILINRKGENVSIKEFEKLYDNDILETKTNSVI